MTGLPCRIYEESWKSAYRGIVPQDYLDHISAGRWAEILDQADWDTLVSVEEGRFIGTASVCPSRWRDWAESGELVSLYLLPEYMGRGYGRLLLEAAVKLLAKHGFQDVLLWVLEDTTKPGASTKQPGLPPPETLWRTKSAESLSGRPYTVVLSKDKPPRAVRRAQEEAPRSPERGASSYFPKRCPCRA